MQLVRCEYVQRHENVIAAVGSGRLSERVLRGLCHRLRPGAPLMEANDERRLLNFQKKLSRLRLLVIDELGFLPLSKSGDEQLFEIIGQRYERGSIFITTNLPFDEWMEVFGCERLTGALLDRLTHHVHILEVNGESFRFKQSRNSTSQDPMCSSHPPG